MPVTNTAMGKTLCFRESKFLLTIPYNINVSQQAAVV